MPREVLESVASRHRVEIELPDKSPTMWPARREALPQVDLMTTSAQGARREPAKSSDAARSPLCACRLTSLSLSRFVA